MNEKELRTIKKEIIQLLKELKKAETLKRHAYLTGGEYLENYLKKKIEFIMTCSELIHNLEPTDEDKQLFSKELLKY